MPFFGLWSGGGETPKKLDGNGTTLQNNNNTNANNNKPDNNINPKALFQETTQTLRLLVSRIDSASSLGERRSAAQELADQVEAKSAWAGPDSLAYCFNPQNIHSLRQVLQDHPDEYDIVASVLQIILAATALPSGSNAWTDIAQGDQSSHRQSAKSFLESSSGNNNNNNNDNHNATINNYNRSPEQQKAHAVQLVSILVEEIPYLLDLIMKNRPTATTTVSDEDNNLSPTYRDKVPFWVQYNAVQLLARIHAADHASFGKYLLQCNAVTTLLEILSDTSNNGVLRDEILVLLQDITLLPANHELQTILAFDNCFDALFNVIKEEGGIISGSVVARECITVMHNICRSNHAAQRLFREMGSLNQVSIMLNSDVYHSSTTPSPSWQQKEISIPPAAAETYSAVGALISTLIRAADSNGEGADIRSACVASNLPRALVRAAMESLPATSGGSYEAEETQLLSTLALCVQGSKQAVDNVINAKVRQFAIDQGVDVPWILVRMALSDSEQQRCSVAAQILTTSIAAGGAEVAEKILLDGLEKPRTSGSPPMKSGYVLAALTMASKQPTPMTWHVAGHLLANCILANPAAGLKAAMIPWSQTNNSNNNNNNNNNNQTNTAQKLNFFGAYLARTRKLIETRQTDLATNIASLYPLLAWMRVCPQPAEACLYQFTADPTTPMFFADWAIACRDTSSHVPLMCCALVALAALMFPPSSSSENSSSMTRDQLHQLITKNITVKRLEHLKNVVMGTDDWNRATRAPVLSSLPSVVVFDQTMCGMISEVIGAVLNAPPTTAGAVAEEIQENVVASNQQQNTNHQMNNENASADPFGSGAEDVDQQQTGSNDDDPFNSNNNDQNQQTEFQQEQDPFASNNENDDCQQQMMNQDNQQQQHQEDDNLPQILQPPQQQTSSTSSQQNHHQHRQMTPRRDDHLVHQQNQQNHQQQYREPSQQQLPTNANNTNNQYNNQNTVSYDKELAEANQTIATTTQQLQETNQKLEAAQESIRKLQDELQDSKNKNEELSREIQHVKNSSRQQVKEIERQKQELQHRFNDSYQLLQRRNEDVRNAEKRAEMAEMKLQDVAKDKNELLLLIVEMEKQYLIAMQNDTNNNEDVTPYQQMQQKEEAYLPYHQTTTEATNKQQQQFRSDDVARYDYQYQQEYENQQRQQEEEESANATLREVVRNSRPDTPAEEQDREQDRQNQEHNDNNDEDPFACEENGNGTNTIGDENQYYDDQQQEGQEVNEGEYNSYDDDQHQQLQYNNTDNENDIGNNNNGDNEDPFAQSTTDDYNDNNNNTDETYNNQQYDNNNDDQQNYTNDEDEDESQNQNNNNTVEYASAYDPFTAGGSNTSAGGGFGSSQGIEEEEVSIR